MIDESLLAILCCPETHQPVRMADPSEVMALNARIAAGQAKNRAGEALKEPVMEGLLRADQKLIYPIRQGIPVMLIDEAIPLSAEVPS